MSPVVQPRASMFAIWSAAVEGRFGTVGSLLRRCSVEVRSPTVARRQAEMLGAFTSNRSSRNRNWDVWSNTSEAMWPPRLNGERTSIGTLNPRPTGPRMPWAVVGSAACPRYSPAVPWGGRGGETWSKKPSFSSYMWNTTVLAHTAGFDANAFNNWLVKYSPKAGGEAGCSSYPIGGRIQLTAGSVPLATSITKS